MLIMSNYQNLGQISALRETIILRTSSFFPPDCFPRLLNAFKAAEVDGLQLDYKTWNGCAFWTVLTPVMTYEYVWHWYNVAYYVLHSQFRHIWILYETIFIWNSCNCYMMIIIMWMRSCQFHILSFIRILHNLSYMIMTWPGLHVRLV